MRLARTSVVYFFSDVVTSIVGFLATLYFARVLGSDVLGKYFLVVALVAWLSVPSNGVAQAINKRVSEGIDGGAFLTGGFLLNGLLSLAVGTAVLLFAPHLNNYVGADIAPLFAVLFAGQVLFTSVSSGLSGQHMVARSGVLKAIDRVLRVAIQLALVFGSFRVAALVGGEAVAVFVSVLVGIFWFQLDFERPSWSHFRKLMSYAKYSWLGNMKGKTFGWMDTLVLSLFVGPGLIAVYEIAWRLASVLILVGNAVGRTMFPEMSKIAVDGRDDELIDLLEEGLFAAGLFVIPGLFGALVVGERVLRIYGSEFVQGGAVLVILIVARGIDTYGTQFENLINAFDRPDLMFRVNAVFVVTNVVLNLVLVSAIGWVGAAIATAASSLLVVALGSYYVSVLLGRPSVPIIEIGIQVLAGGLMAASVWVLQAFLPWTNMYATICLVVVGAMIFFALLLVLSSRFQRKVFTVLPDRIAA